MNRTIFNYEGKEYSRAMLSDCTCEFLRMKDRPKPEIHNTKGTIKFKFMCLFHLNIENQRIRGKFAGNIYDRNDENDEDYSTFECMGF